MVIKQVKNDKELLVSLSGRLDTNTSTELESALKGALDDVDSLILDFKDLDYMSSSGLRILLTLQKQMSVKGKLTVRNVNEFIMDILNMTGFSDILNIE